MFLRQDDIMTNIPHSALIVNIITVRDVAETHLKFKVLQNFLNIIDVITPSYRCNIDIM